MPKRTIEIRDQAGMVASPGLQTAPVLDLMCSHFVLTLASKQGSKFNVRRDINGLMALAGRHLMWPDAVLNRVREFLSRRCKDNDSWRGHEQLSNEEFLERHGVWRGPYEEGSLFYYLDEYAKDAPKDLLTLLSSTGQWLSHAVKKQSTLVETNIDSLANLLQLNKAERALLLYGTLARHQRDLRSLLVEFKVNNAPEAYAAIADLAGVQATDVADALRAGGRLERIGLVENLLSENSITDLADLMKVSEKLPPVLMREYRDRAELMAVFTRPATPSELKANDFEFAGDDVQVLVNLLRKAMQTKALGVNVLLYGPPGTGKTELAKVVAREAGLDLFEVEYADRDGNSLSGRDRYRSLQIAQVFLKGAEAAALLFDEVEDVFPPISVDAAGLMARADQQAISAAVSHSVNGKAWVNQILESNTVPTIWVTNRIEQIDPAFRRRFAYHLELKSPPPGAREQLIRKTLDGVAVSDAFVAKLTERKGLTPAQIRTAVRFADLAHAGPEAGGEAFEALIDRQLKNSDAALGRKPDGSAKKGRRQVTTYDLDMLNVETRFEIPRIVEALKARGHGALCFYGAPGTGKTALGEYIAEHLGQPLIVKQASDLVSKFVGETEQNMAAMFAEATQEKAVLLLDEADSFLMDRRGAQRSYEVTEVNEMLQQMERHDGVFICTTNLLDRIDQAALRRFTFKIKFMPLTAEQREKMFITEALAGDAQKLTPEVSRRLAKLEQLAPGDFAAVKRQCDILAAEFSVEEFIEQLEAEHRIKPEVREQRSMGFVQ
ncbi:ATP-binding protein (plasmid) [Diaphorobacter sp. HDW4B]|uniref:ATP-binding protein n=1 Tax=Diaphorobacter sp. HDW4B TaxID=2714925 RepID=UPI00140AB4CD|nr:ATP-binding protein [Diaphorobacter sp. HDW4B]QIL74286.1 ATP-binding protein [Diaphorobacter sp. HDW4B]